MEPNDTNRIIYVKDENGEYVPESENRKKSKKSRVISSAEKREKIVFWVRFAILAILETACCFIMLNLFPESPLPLTVSMAFVAITAILYGPLYASMIGAVGATASTIAFSVMPEASKVAFIYSPFVGGGGLQSILISLVSFVLAGLVVSIVFSSISAVYNAHLAKSGKKQAIWHMPLIYAVSAAVGALLQVIFVTAGIYLCFSDAFALAAGYNVSLTPIMLGGIILSKGSIEAVVTALLAVAVCTPFKYFKEKLKRKA